MSEEMIIKHYHTEQQEKNHLALSYKKILQGLHVHVEGNVIIIVQNVKQ